MGKLNFKYEFQLRIEAALPIETDGEMVKNKENYATTMAMIVVFVVMLGLLSFRAVPIVAPDENGVIAVAQYVSGNDFVKMGAAAYYSPLAGVIYAPLMALIDDPWAVYKGMILINIAIMTLCVPLMIAVAKDVSGRSHWLFPISAAIIMLWPSNTVHAGMASPEAIFRFFVLLASLAAIRSAKTGHLLWCLVLGASSVLLYQAHSRALLVPPLAVIYLVVLALFRLISIRNSIVSIVFLITLILIAWKFDKILIETVWEGGSAVGRKYLYINLKAALTQPLKAVLALDVFFGQIWYQVAASFGWVVVGLWYLLKSIYTTKDRGEQLSIGFMLLMVSSVFAASVGHMIGATRVDHVIYGRYVDGATILLFWLGAVSIILEIKMRDRIGISLFVAIFSTWVAFILLQSKVLSGLVPVHPNNVAGLSSFFYWYPTTLWQVFGAGVGVSLVGAIALSSVRPPAMMVAFLFCALVVEHSLLMPKFAAHSYRVESRLRQDISKIPADKPIFWMREDRNSLWLYHLQFMIGRPFKDLPKNGILPDHSIIITDLPYSGKSKCTTVLRSNLRIIGFCPGKS